MARNYHNTERGERLLLYREGRLFFFIKRKKYSPGPDRCEIQYSTATVRELLFYRDRRKAVLPSHRKRRMTPLVLREGDATPPHREEKDSSCTYRRERLAHYRNTSLVLTYVKYSTSQKRITTLVLIQETLSP